MDAASEQPRRTNMSDNETTTSTTSGNRPTHIAYWVRDREDKKSVWTRCGAAWAHADGKGFNIALDLQPLDGRITLREAGEPKE
jgi:hypothetical protein